MAEEAKRAIDRNRPPDVPWVPIPNSPQGKALESPADELFFGGAAGGGKMLCLAMRIATPAGWTTIGDLSPGDEIFDERGIVTRVVAVHPIEQAPVSYRLTFDDGVTLDACEDHLWLTFDARELGQITRLDPDWRAARQARRESRVTGTKSEKFTASLVARNAARTWEHKPTPSGTVRSTGQIADTLLTASGRRNHAIPIAKPLELPTADLLIDPYVLGAWLGDGNSRHASITCHDPAILWEIERAGFVISPRAEVGAYGINDGLIGRLRELDLLNNKHIPPIYLRASLDQRLSLLQGLMDTDGNCTERGACEFTTTRPALRDGFRELLATLGIKGEGSEGRATLDGVDCGPKYRFKFVTSHVAFRLERKRGRQNFAPRRTTAFRYIVKCEKIAPKPMRCITVDSPSRLYLAGDSMVPTHNTDLLIGMAISRHQRSIIYRRRFKDLQGLRERSNAIYFPYGTFNGQREIWRLNYLKPRVIEFGAVQLEEDWQKYQGRPNDLCAFDELAHFSRMQYRRLIGWNRSSDPNQRVRVIATGNPPTSAEGDWVISYWGPWLDKTHPDPAADGELRWFATIKGEDIEVSGPDPIWATGEADPIKPRSRSFIRARVQDNPHLMASGYMSVLQGLPEPMRSQMLFGDFEAGQEDNEQQVIPTAWVLAAQARWTPEAPGWMDAIGVDVARGGDDKTVLSPRHGAWMGQQKVYRGESTPDGPMVAQLVFGAIPAGQRPNVMIDIIGVGSSPYDSAMQMGMDAHAMNASEKSFERDKTGKLGFINRRAEWWWKMREMLDPDSGEHIALPPDRELRADLTAPRWKMALSGIQIESKDDVRERIGRSPDKGDSAVLAFAQPPRRSVNRMI